MFTGLIREIGVLRRVTAGHELSRLQIHAPRTASRVGVGDSLAVNGICLTVTCVRRDLMLGSECGVDVDREAVVLDGAYVQTLPRERIRATTSWPV